MLPGLGRSGYLRSIGNPSYTFCLNETALKSFKYSISLLAIFGCVIGLGLNPIVNALEATATQPLEPEVAEASDEAAQSMQGIAVKQGWTIDLFAAEPLVANVVSFDIDHQGRLFLCESFRQDRGVTDNRSHNDEWVLADLSAKTVQDRINYHRSLLGDAAITYAQHDDRIRRLVDSNGDGRADRSDLFASGFNHLEEGTGAGVLVRGNEVFYTCIPRLWKLTDDDNDGVSDQRVALSDGYGVRVAFRGHDLHGLVMGPDGRIYFSIGDRGYHVTTGDGKVLANPAEGAVFRCEPDGSGLEVFCSGLRNPQELAFNELGDWFTVDNNSDSGDKAKVFHLLEKGDYGWRMYYQYLPTRGPYNEDRLWEPLHPEQAAYIVPAIANFTDGPSGLAYYPGTGFGDELKDSFLVCDFVGSSGLSGVRSFKLNRQGASYKLTEPANPVWSVLATDVAFGPDGAIYVSDWVDGWSGTGKGRIYRVTDPEHHDSEIVREVSAVLASDWSQRTPQNLVLDLSHLDQRIRLEAQWELARRVDTASLLGIATDAKQTMLARLHAIWGSDQIARVNNDQRAEVVAALRPLLADTDPVLRGAVVKVLGERGDQESVPELSPLLADESPRVRYFAAMALAKLKASSAMPAVIQMMLENNNQDAVLRHAGQVFFTSACSAESIMKLHKHENESLRRSAVVALRRIKSGEVSKFLADESTLVALEAARAIHDEPIPVALGSLAALIEKPSANLPLLRRVINANYQLGTAASATALAKFASRLTSPEAMRLEALDVLMKWDQSDPRDRVLNDIRPLGERAATDPVAALDAHIDTLMMSSENVREKAIEVASKLGVKKIAPALVTRVNDANQAARARASALRGLAKLDPANAVKLAKETRLVPADALAEAALRVLAEHDLAASIEVMIAATQSRNASLQRIAWDTLAQSTDPRASEAIQAALQSYLAGTLQPEVQLNVVEAAESLLAQGKLPDTVAANLKQFQTSLAENDPLGKWLLSLHGGNVAKGKRLFAKTELSCVRCHKVDRTGGEVGPNLTTIGSDKDARYLLESICLPNAAIAKGFETAVIADEDGQVVTGIVKSESDEVIEVIQSDGVLKRIDQTQIVARRSGKSAMPADLIKQLSARELRDLVAYLASLKDKSPAAAGH
ncbi:Cytochrome c [Novipirellula galeiformis]|uniref:Cytochrome c n=1 Tax=Novipirellula galeiformis TaxID=2528004 RepID=A0A5C6CBL4_9BACT|nr:Cytochrome c [Novipirellula galeiformis]